MEIWFGIDRRSVHGITCALRHAVMSKSLTMLTMVMIKVRVWLQYFSTNIGLDDEHTPTLSTPSFLPEVWSMNPVG
jgi:hypothetical protein